MFRAAATYKWTVMHPTDPLLVLCTGIVRSASTWSFNVCRHLGMFRARQQQQPFSSGYVGEADLEREIEVGLRRIEGPTVLKAHGIGPRAVAALRDGRAQGVCTFRDPRDCVASDLAFRKLDFDPAVRRVSQNLTYLGFYRAARRTLFVRYEDMVADPLRQVTRIAAHLGVDAGPIDLRRIDATTSLSSARAISAGLSHRPSDEVAWSESRRVDVATQLHENHIHSGRVGRWRDELSADQQAELNDVFHPWLVELGYEPATVGPVAYA